MADDTPTLSRRKVLSSLGVMGGAAALSGAGTMAGFTDAEEKIGWLTTGEVDLLMDYRSTYVPWERFDLNPNDLLTDGDYSNGEAVPVDGDDMTYVVGQAPDFRVDDDDDGVAGADDPAVSGEDWAALTRTLDACQFPNSTDIRPDDNDLAVNGTNIAVYGSPGVTDTFETGYVDGFTGMQVDLMDVKPLDHGESTISLHVCGNPSFLYFSFDYDYDGETKLDLEIGDTNDPEFDAGDKNDGTGKYSDAGELDDFLWVRLWQDANCSNTLDEGEVVLYEGSLRGLIEMTKDGIQLNPLQLADVNGDGTASGTDLPLAEDELFTCGGNPRCDNLHDIQVDGETLGDIGYNFSERLVVEPEDLPPVGGETTIDGITIYREANGCISYSDPDDTVCAVIMKGGGGPDLPAAAANVYVGSTTSSLEGDVLCTVTPGGSGDPADISRIDFCTCEFDNGEIPPSEVPLCIDDACIAYEWFLPQELTQDDDMGFAELPSDAAPGDIDGDGFVSLADEIVDHFGLNNRNQIDINAVQTDAVHYKTEFVAEQCRHHLGGMNNGGNEA